MSFSFSLSGASITIEAEGNKPIEVNGKKLTKFFMPPGQIMWIEEEKQTVTFVLNGAQVS
jgi:hypothetical protein